MSGGSFDYKNYVLTDIADTIDVYADKCARGYTDEYGSSYSATEYTLDKLYKTVNELRELERRLHLIDYMMAGDIGEDHLRQRWNEYKADEPLVCALTEVIEEARSRLALHHDSEYGKRMQTLTVCPVCQSEEDDGPNGINNIFNQIDDVLNRVKKEKARG